MTLRELADHFHATRNGKGYVAHCPIHDDSTASLGLDQGDTGLLVRCRAGCDTGDVLAAVGLTFAHLADAPERSTGRTIVATYDYTDEAGALLYQAVRFAPKDFRQRAPNGDGTWTWSTKGLRKVPYRLHQLQGCKTVYLVEGEKDADALWALGLPATTNVGGAGKWDDGYVMLLVDAGVENLVAFPDNDPPGATHARTAADSGVRGGLRVKLVPLPGVPPKGDVSDYLGTHTVAQLGALVKAAPLHDPHRSVAAPPEALPFGTLEDFLMTQETTIDYVVQDRIPAGSICLFCAPPKTGKSTASRGLALAVAQGIPWMGWRTTQGPAWLLAFEDQPGEVRAHLRRMGATVHDPMSLHVGPAPENLLGALHERAVRERPRLIVIDHLGHILKAKDYNDYAQVTERFTPLLAVARDSGAALVLNYHASSHSQREGLDAVLGSTAISASVDNILVLKRAETQRVISTVQRIGPSLEPTLIELNAETGWFETLGRKHEIDALQLGDRMRDALREAGEPLGEATLHSQVVGGHQEKVRVLRKLVGMQWIVRLGRGGRHDPYRYTLPHLVPVGSEGPSGFSEVPGTTDEQVSPRQNNEQEKNSQESSGTSKRRFSSTTPADETPLFDPKGWLK